MRVARSFDLLWCLAALLVPVWESAAQSRGATIQGTVFDSMSVRPIPTALVQLARLRTTGGVDFTRVARTDALGRFTFDSVSAGLYLVGFQDLALDSLGVRTSLHRVDVRGEGSVRVALAVPSMRTLVVARCGASAQQDSLSLLVGSVLRAEQDASVADAFVSVQWAEVFLSPAGVARTLRDHDLRSDSTGWFSACVPSNTPVQLRAERDEFRSDRVDVVVSSLAVRRRDLYIAAAPTAILSEAGDSIRTFGAVNDGDRLVRSGGGRVTGRIQRLDGRPLAGAIISLAGTIRQTRSDEDGEFELTGLPLGTGTLEVRAVGYVPTSQTIDVVGFRETTESVTLHDIAGTSLDTVRVSARTRMTEALAAGFTRRRISGAGQFADESLLDTLRRDSFTDIARLFPALTIPGTSDRKLMLRGVFGEPCAPTIWVDGTRLVEGGVDVDQLVHPSNVRRVEVYARGVTTPAEFTTNHNCGVVVLWTAGVVPQRARRDQQGR